MKNESPRYSLNTRNVCSMALLLPRTASASSFSTGNAASAFVVPFRKYTNHAVVRPGLQLVTNPRVGDGNGQAVAGKQWRPRQQQQQQQPRVQWTHLNNSNNNKQDDDEHDNNINNDFNNSDSINSSDENMNIYNHQLLQEEKKAQQLAQQFYKELEYRQNRLSEFEWDSNGYCDDEEETYFVFDRNNVDGSGDNGGSRRGRRSLNSKNSGRRNSNANRKRFNDQSSSTTNTSTRRVFINSQPSPSMISFSPIFEFFGFAPQDANAAASTRSSGNAGGGTSNTSAGLFSGAGSTVYSSGRSIRAEIDILDATIQNTNELEHRQQQRRQQQLVVGTLILLSALYIAVELSGVASTSSTELLSWWNVNEASSFVEQILEGAAGGVAVGVDKAGEAMWWLEESLASGGSVVEVVARSVEELVML